MGLFDLFGSREAAKPRDKKKLVEVRAEEVTRAKLASAREVLRDAEKAAEKGRNTKVQVALVREARAELALGNETRAVGLVNTALGKVWARKLRTAMQARATRKPKAKPEEGEAAKPARTRAPAKPKEA